MATIVRDHLYVDGKPARPSHANANEDKLYAEINGNLDWENIKAALVNAANGILKLDGSARVLLAQIPDTLTGKDADTLDSKHYSDIATEIDEDIAAHKADASAHHAKTVNADIDHGSIGGLADNDHPQYLLKAGGTMEGALTLHGAPTLNLHAATKKYVDDEIVAGGFGDMLKSVYDTGNNGVVDNAEKLEGSTKTQVQDHTPKAHTLNSHSDPDGALSMNSQKITSLLDPTADQDGATKKYIDDAITPISSGLPAPDYESAWTGIANNAEGTFTHNLGTSGILAQVLIKYSDNVFHYSTNGIAGDDKWVHYYTDNSLVVRNGIGDTAQFKVQVWKIRS